MTAIASISDEIRRLKAEKKAVILAHNYQRPEVQDAADFVGDSLGLSRKAAETDARIIVFCGVHFMAETASILCPDKKVLLPDIEAGCSLSATITAEELRKWKAQHPGAIVVSYVNTTAEVKAETDYCCTSGNAAKVVAAIPADKEILFCPDMFLGNYVKKMTGRQNMRIWAGECHVHAGIRTEDLDKMQAAHPDAETIIHPECGCASAFLYATADRKPQPSLLSTEGMTRHVAASPAKEFLIATETGIIYRMQKQNPGKKFFPVNEHAVCQFMKKITIEKVLLCLQNEAPEVRVPKAVADKARLSIERMVAIG
jgi:quinolinate synthase